MIQTDFLNIDNCHNYPEFVRELDGHPQATRIASDLVEDQATVIQTVQNLFQSCVKNKFSPEKGPLIEAKWDLIWEQACANCGENSRDASLFLQTEKVKKLTAELNTILEGVETEGVYPYENADLVPGEPIKNAFKYLLHSISLTREIANLSTARLALFPNEEQQGALIDEIRSLFRKLFEMVRGSPNDPVLELLIGHLINIYAFLSCSQNGELIEIPRKIDDVWQLVEFRLERIPLNSDWLGEVIEAFGLTPTQRRDADPLLAFKGTRGTLSRLTDFNPCLGVGELLYWLGKDKIDTWLHDNVQAGRRAQIYGMSLGGAMAYHTAAHHPDLVEIHAYAPPGVLARNLGDAEIRGEIFMDPNDYVSRIGTHPVGPKMVKVIRGTPLNPALSHVRLYGGEETLLLHVNPTMENQRTSRTVLTILHQIISIPFCLLYTLACLVQGIFNQIAKLIPASPESRGLTLQET